LPRKDLQNFLEEALRQDEDSPLSSNSNLWVSKARGPCGLQ
jgi:hypothetical protein